MSLIQDIVSCRELYWENADVVRGAKALDAAGEAEKIVDIDDAEARLARFAPFIKRVFPDVEDGIIESKLAEIPNMQRECSRY